MGKLDRRFPNVASAGRFSSRTELVFSRRGFMRYLKRYINGKRRYGQFSMRPENRDATGKHKNTFMTKQKGSARGNRAD